jgi:preprotein translocase subunit SecF
MKNKLETFAVFLVVLLSLLIIGLIVQYNMIEEQKSSIDVSKLIASKAKKSKEDVNDYLNKMEHYKEKDVQVDASGGKKASEVNIEKPKAELKNDDIVNDISAAVDEAMDGE